MPDAKRLNNVAPDIHCPNFLSLRGRRAMRRGPPEEGHRTGQEQDLEEVRTRPVTAVAGEGCDMVEHECVDVRPETGVIG